MANYRKQLMVESGSKVKIKNFDPDAIEKGLTRELAQPILQKNLEKIDHLQFLMYSQAKHSLLIVLQGMDSAGKDGVIRKVFTAMNPMGCTVTRFAKPTAEEEAHDFLWRVHPHAPRKGAVAVFNRSHYESVLVVRVHNLVPEKIWSQRYEQINDLERLLTVDNQTTILKFFLNISKKEQLERFGDRLSDSDRQWKISESDYSEREYWGDYMEAFEALLQKTSTKVAPWYVIPSNRKWYRDLMVSQIVVDTLEALQMKPPSPTVDIKGIRRKYHQASGRIAK